MQRATVICALLGLCCSLALGARGAQPPQDGQWKEVTIGGQVNYVVPPEILSSLGVPYEEIPDERNAATYYIQATNALPPVEPEEEGLKEQYDAARRGPWSLDDGKFSAWFRSTEQARRLLRKAATMDKCQFPFTATDRGETMLCAMTMAPYLSGIRNLARLMVMEGHLQEQDGHDREALDAYLAVFRMGKHLRRGRTLLDGLVGIAVHSIASGAVSECLARHDVPADVLDGLARDLDGLAPGPEERGAWIAGERAQGLQIARMSPAAWMSMEGEGPDTRPAEQVFLGSRAFRIVWPDRTLCKDFESFYDKLDQFARMPTWEATKALQDFDEEVYFKDWDVLGQMLAPAVGGVMTEHIRLAARHDALRLNVALRRFRAATGHYPEALAELAPAYLKELPPDPFTGKPFRYRREGDGWLFYSVGENQEDDGGTKSDRYGEGDVAFWSDAREGQKP